jgi:hypothetical protein
MTGGTAVDDFKIAEQFLPIGGVAGVSPAEGEAEKPEALKRGGDFPHFSFIVSST